MVSYLTLLNAMKEKFKEEIFDTARTLNHNLTDEDILRAAKIVIAHIETEYKPPLNALTVDFSVGDLSELERRVSEWH